MPQNAIWISHRNAINCWLRSNVGNIISLYDLWWKPCDKIWAESHRETMNHRVWTLNLNKWEKWMNCFFKSNAKIQLFVSFSSHHKHIIFQGDYFLTLAVFLRSLFCFSAELYVLLIKSRGVILCRITPRNVCIYTSEEDSKWMGICERLESNKSIEMFLFLFSSPGECDWKSVGWSKCLCLRGSICSFIVTFNGS